MLEWYVTRFRYYYQEKADRLENIVNDDHSGNKCQYRRCGF